jgi:hypothetical protein
MGERFGYKERQGTTTNVSGCQQSVASTGGLPINSPGAEDRPRKNEQPAAGSLTFAVVRPQEATKSRSGTQLATCNPQTRNSQPATRNARSTTRQHHRRAGSSDRSSFGYAAPDPAQFELIFAAG